MTQITVPAYSTILHQNEPLHAEKPTLKSVSEDTISSVKTSTLEKPASDTNEYDECVEEDSPDEEDDDEPSLPPIPEGLEPLKHQLAGHKFGHEDNSDIYGILDCKDGTLLKPVLMKSKGLREKYFYEMLNGIYTENKCFKKELHDSETIRQLKQFTPAFKGFVTIPAHNNVSYIKMVDISYGMQTPHLLDIKIGAKAWDPRASIEKQNRQKARCPYLDTICFQVLGAKYFDYATGDMIMKLNLRKYTPHDLLHKGFYDIFRGLTEDARPLILDYIIQDLNDILEWFNSQALLSFHGSSILIVFETDPKVLEAAISNLPPTKVNTELITHCGRRKSRLLQLKMIDFVHVWETSQPDKNYIDGIKVLISYMTSLLEIFKTERSNR